ncbi:MAG: mechanosensitive ion channel family protein [Nanoarchaeota archaeon]|nr:mechanosensitive ion channel family protein [Nanoarchaeota archaeon]
MIELSTIWDTVNGRLIPFLRGLILFVIILLAFNVALKLIRKSLLKKAKTKHQKSNVEIFTKVIKYVFVVILFLFVIFSASGGWTGFGLSVGLFSAALGWALQRPITGMAGWIMVITKRPFEIGDRIIIGSVKGDVVDINLTHIYISEVGGIVRGEENSGRYIMIPNSKLFEVDITNYTFDTEYILDQVSVTVTFEGNLDKAMKIAKEAAIKHTKEFMDKTKSKPYIRTYFKDFGMEVRVRYLSPAKRVQEISSYITKEIYDRIKSEKDVQIAYPHQEIILRK